MENTLHEMSGGHLDALLSEACAALRVGDAPRCEALAKSVLAVARKRQDLHLEARALLCLANGDRLVSRFRRANGSSQRAASLFQQVGDIGGESAALSTLSYTYGALGRSEEAVEAALLSLHLSELLPPGPALAMSYNYLGIAYACDRSYEQADEAFSTAIVILQSVGLDAEAVLPWLNQCNTEVTRVFFERHHTGQLPDLGRLQALRVRYTPPMGAAQSPHTLHSAHVISPALWLLLAGIENCWQGQLEEAQLNVELCATSAASHPWTASLAIFESWLRAEIAWARKDWQEAEQHTDKMIELARETEHEPFVAIGHLLASQILAEQGHDQAAKEALKTLRMRKQELRNDFLRSRETVVAWQIKVRKNNADLQRMEVTSKSLEKLSFEDPLTGLANRRRFTEIVPALLSYGLARGRPPFIALIDIDQFKQVNDRFSHQVGDQVLQRVAQILRLHLREDDVPARLGGDEFALAFRHEGALDVEQICQRICVAVQDFDWDSIRAGLRVSVSIGFAQAEPGDSVETLTHRADLAMYSMKKELR